MKIAIALALLLASAAACAGEAPRSDDSLDDLLNADGAPAVVLNHPPQTHTDGALFREQFETMPVGSSWFKGSNDPDHELDVISYTTGGISGRILRIQYIPSWDGTRRITHRFMFEEKVASATLSYDVKFHSDFEWVKGGKLHGLGGGQWTTGGDDPVPNGWSVRQMWRANGVPELYVYDQDRVIGSYGTQYTHQGSFKYQRGIWYRVDLYVKMNTHPLAADGEARLYIDGTQRAYAPTLRLAGLYNGTFETMIDAFGINTIYGGNDRTWSPSVPTFAYFDNFTVRSGLHVTGTRGTSCEIFEEGTLSHSGGVCCDDICGACGGTGCSSLPGGASSCCTGTITTNGDPCTQTGVSAPCYYP